jgi:hypothetical protein
MESLNYSKSLAYQIVKIIRKYFDDPKFLNNHRAHPKDFSRQRMLSFSRVVVIVLQKTVRSIQLHLHDFFRELGNRVGWVSASAWTQARAKLRHTAFIELNERAILDQVYPPQGQFEVRLWHGHRLLAIDSSLLRLPNEEEVGERFGWVDCKNNTGPCGRYAQGRLSILTDVLNRMALDTRLVNWKQDERSLGCEHLAKLKEMDLVLLDRGYAGYEVFAQLVKAKGFFVCRCSANGFAAVNNLFARGDAGRSQTVVITPPNGTMKEIRQRELPEKITIRFVSIRLSSGELEVLATNLLDEQKYSAEVLGEVYGNRWGIETYYGLLKGRLDLENFSGRTVESVLQDLHATVFLSNFESVVTRPSAQTLATGSMEHRHEKAINHAVSFHTIKSHIVELLLSGRPIDEVLAEMERLFLQNPVSKRHRDVPRKKISAWRSYHHRRSERKVVF